MLHSFSGSDGQDPRAALTNVNTTLYGTTFEGGSGPCGFPYNGCGTVFSITNDGQEHVLHSFGGGSDGMFPAAKLVLLNGVLYGTTSKGGTDRGGTVFSITTTGQERVLYSFKRRKSRGSFRDGFSPWSGLISFRGILYGTTQFGGILNYNRCSDNLGCGTVFSITTGGKEHVLYKFQGGTDGGIPVASLIILNGTFYGTASSAGSYGSSCYGLPNGCGTVFSLSPAGQFNVVYTFMGAPNDGAGPEAPLTVLASTFYGTTAGGGHTNSHGGPWGVIYSLSPTGQEHVLHYFGGGSDGYNLFWGGLTSLKGTLYGVTDLGGTHDQGTVFALTP